MRKRRDGACAAGGAQGIQSQAERRMEGRIMSRIWGRVMKIGVGVLILGVVAGAGVQARMGLRAQRTYEKAAGSVATAGSAAKLERMPEALETRFALSAAPPHLRENATTYLLDPAKGYVLGRKGTNGVSCIVVRSDWQFDAAFRDDVYWAVCYDAEGSKTL